MLAYYRSLTFLSSIKIRYEKLSKAGKPQNHTLLGNLNHTNMQRYMKTVAKISQICKMLYDGIKKSVTLFSHYDFRN